MASPSAIALRNVSKLFQKRTIRREYTTFKTELVRWLRGEKRPERATHITALHDINLEIHRGQTVGLIGRNGAGKSTLLKLMTGIYTPSSGKIEVNGRISALLELGAGFHPDFSGRENIVINGIILGMSRAEAVSKTQEIIDFSELGDFIDEPVRTYSSGMYMRLAFSVATHVDPDILIIDEILAVGDAHFSQKSLAKMNEFKRAGKTIVLVTHDLATVETWCDTAAWIDAGTLKKVGSPSDVVAQYRAEVARAEAEALPTSPSPTLASSTATRVPKPRAGPQAPWEQRWGTFAVEIESIVLLVADSKVVGKIDPEDALTVMLNYRVHRPTEPWSLSVSVRSAAGLELFRTRSSDTAMDLPVSPETASGTACLTIDRISLAGGEYFIDVAAQTTSGLDLDCQRGLFTFAVQAGSDHAGILHLPFRWESSARS